MFTSCFHLRRVLIFVLIYWKLRRVLIGDYTFRQTLF